MEFSKKRIGSLGEDIACRYLKNKKFVILERNFIKTWSGAEKCEIDVIARKADIVHFVEVKTLLAKGGDSSNNFSSAFSKVDYLKKRKIEKAAEYWIGKNKIPLESKFQIDVVAIKISNTFSDAKIKVIENI
jgi:putative endonuclease